MSSAAVFADRAAEINILLAYSHMKVEMKLTCKPSLEANSDGRHGHKGHHDEWEDSGYDVIMEVGNAVVVVDSTWGPRRTGMGIEKASAILGDEKLGWMQSFDERKVWV